jgi:DNA-binding transcriptional ArsR family regulator
MLSSEANPIEEVILPLFEPQPFQVVTDPQQIKAFTDPLRIRVLNVLKQRSATNQQIADTLAEPQAKVLYHIRFLLDAGLIRLVDQRIRGGNIEKYYRSVAHVFSLRPEHETRSSQQLASTALAAVQQEVLASEQAWPEPGPAWETRRVRLPAHLQEAFYQRFSALVAEYWGGPQLHGNGTTEVHPAPEEDPTSPTVCFAAVIYRDPTEVETGSGRLQENA